MRRDCGIMDSTERANALSMLPGGGTFQGLLTTPGDATTSPNLGGGVVNSLFFLGEPMRPIITLESGARIYRDCHESLLRIAEKCNEIEQRFLLAAINSPDSQEYCIGTWEDSVNIPTIIDRIMHCLNVVPQFQIGRYRIDFLVSDSDETARIAVEIDGHDFHEKTREQARNDRRRERALTMQGYRVVRFTGSEVFHDAQQCWAETVSIFRTAIHG